VNKSPDNKLRSGRELGGGAGDLSCREIPHVFRSHTGDGGFGIALNGMMTARDENIPIVTVVFNNAMLGWVRHGQGTRPIASKFAEYDHAAIGRAMGCEGIRVERAADLPEAIGRAIASGRPTIVDVVTSGDPTFRDVQTPLAQYP